MKFSCENNEITYIVETKLGAKTEFQYHFILTSKQKRMLEDEIMKYFTISINAKDSELDLNFEIQGVPLHPNDEIQMEDLDFFFDNQRIYEKIEDIFDMNDIVGIKTAWAVENDEKKKKK